MPHLSGRSIDVIGSVEGFRLVSQEAGAPGLESLLRQTGAGYEMSEMGDVWKLYVPSGDSYDDAHGFFGGAIYAISNDSLQAPGKLTSLLPLDEFELGPDDTDPGPDPDAEHDESIMGHLMGHLGSTLRDVSGLDNLMTAGEYLSNVDWHAALDMAMFGRGGTGQETKAPSLLADKEPNVVALSLGFRGR